MIVKNDLGKSMPALEKMKVITQKDHDTRFFSEFQNKDVWTADGWIITAIQDDGITCHIRKGVEVEKRVIPSTTLLYVA